MNVLIINLILNTPLDGVIERRLTNTDCMIYALARGFVDEGHDVTLVASEEYRPIEPDCEPFDIVYFPSAFTSVARPNLLPCPRRLRKWLTYNHHRYDMVLTSELFSIASLIAMRVCPGKVIVWHELAVMQKAFRRFPARIWYNVVTPLFMRNAIAVCRSVQARDFLRRYLDRVVDDTVDHGCDSRIFYPDYDGAHTDSFITISRLIKRKRIDRIIRNFSDFVKDPRYSRFRLDIVGDGPELEALRSLTTALGISDHVIFHGFLTHRQFAAIGRHAVALLIDTAQDNNMVSISEAIVNGTPVLTDTVPTNAALVARHQCGMAADDWGVEELRNLVDNYDRYHANCVEVGRTLTSRACAHRLVDIFRQTHNIKSDI